MVMSMKKLISNIMVKSMEKVINTWEGTTSCINCGRKGIGERKSGDKIGR